MAEKNIQIKNLQGDLLYPATKAAVVTNDAGQHLGGVEAGAQVNKIEKISVNGVELSIVSKAVNVEIPAAAEYSIEKASSAEEGYAATYQLTKDGTAVGAKINIPKDMVVESGSVKICELEGDPVEGFKVGDKYIDLVLANAESSHIYILVSDLVDVYTGSNGVKVEGLTITADMEYLAQTFAKSEDVTDALAEKADQSFVEEELGKKVDSTTYATDKAGLEAAINAKVDQTAYDAAIALKADKTYVDEELAKKVDVESNTAAMALKADKSYVDEELAKKVNTSDFEAFKTTNTQAIADAVAPKAEQSALEALSGVVDTKAAQADLEALTETVDTKADKETTYTKTEVDGKLTDVLTYEVLA